MTVRLLIFVLLFQFHAAANHSPEKANRGTINQSYTMNVDWRRVSLLI